jgi:hypothetical protein
VIARSHGSPTVILREVQPTEESGSAKSCSLPSPPGVSRREGVMLVLHRISRVALRFLAGSASHTRLRYLVRDDRQAVATAARRWYTESMPEASQLLARRSSVATLDGGTHRIDAEGITAISQAVERSETPGKQAPIEISPRRGDSRFDEAIHDEFRPRSRPPDYNAHFLDETRICQPAPPTSATHRGRCK